MKECITHHICDCKQAEMEVLKEELQRLLIESEVYKLYAEKLEKLLSSPRSAEKPEP